MGKFRITDCKGFSITFDNGYTVSVQFGPGNYCDNYEAPIGRSELECGRRGSSTAECAVIDPQGDMVRMFDGDTVSSRSTPEEVAELIADICSRGKVKA